MEASFVSKNVPNVINNIEESKDEEASAEPTVRTVRRHHYGTTQVVSSDLKKFIKSKDDL